MKRTADQSRHDSPNFAIATELPPAQRRDQLPLTLRLPSPELLARFRRLAVHLQTSHMRMLPKPPIALNIRQIDEVQYQIQLHISPELTVDPSVCRDLYDAITAFMSLWGVGTSFSGDQNSEEGVGVFNAVAAPQSPWGQEDLDATLGAVIQIARFVQVVDGDVNRLAKLLSDSELAPHLLSIGMSLSCVDDGAAGKLRTLVRIDRPIDPAAIQKTASRFVEMGHLDLAMMVLATGIRHAHRSHLALSIDAFLSLLENTPLLSNDRNLQIAYELIDQLILPDSAKDNVDHQATCIRCFRLVNHLVNLSMPEAALAFASRIYLERPALQRTQAELWESGWRGVDHIWTPLQYPIAIEELVIPVWDEAYQSTLERIWNAPPGSIEIMQDIVDTLSGMRQDWAKGLHAQYAPTLLETKAARDVLESPQRVTLELLGFAFDHDRDSKGGFVIKPRGGIRSDQINEDLITITISNAGEGGFVPSVHGDGMVEYAESLLEGSPSLDHLSKFGFPTIDFLMEHFAQLPQAVQQRLLALAETVISLADSAMRSPTAPIGLRAVLLLKYVRLFVEANVLYKVLDLLPTLAMKLKQRVAALFKGAAIMGTAEATELIFGCWKTLTSADDLACHTLLLQSARMSAQVSTNRQMIENARKALKESLERANALDLHRALLDFIANGGMFGVMFRAAMSGPTSRDMFDRELPEWAMTTLAEMASDPVSVQLCKVSPNAAAWPFWLHAKLSLKNLSSEGRLTLLTKCAKLDGVVADDRWDALFVGVIGREIFDIDGDEDKRYSLALQAFMIWQLVPRAEVGNREPLPIAFVRMLVSSLHKAIVDRRPFTGVDSQQAMTALLDQMVQWDAEAALKQLDSILASKVIQEDHPTLGVKLCVMFSGHPTKMGDSRWLASVLTKGLVHGLRSGLPC